MMMQGLEEVLPLGLEKSRGAVLWYQSTCADEHARDRNRQACIWARWHYYGSLQPGGYERDGNANKAQGSKATGVRSV